MSTLEVQLRALAAHVRDPDGTALPHGLDPARLRVYRDLVRSNLGGLLASTFPVIRRTLGEPAWRQLVDAFLAGHVARTPLFARIGLELVAWLEAAPDPQRPWLAELAHYEWAELGLQVSDASVPAHDPQGDLVEGIPLLSPLAWPLAYRWPVDRIGPDWIPSEPGDAPTLVLLRREVGGAVRFSRLSPLLFQLLQSIGAGERRSGRQLLATLAGDAGRGDVDAFIDEARPMLERLRVDGVVPGTLC